MKSLEKRNSIRAFQPWFAWYPVKAVIMGGKRKWMWRKLVMREGILDRKGRYKFDYYDSYEFCDSRGRIATEVKLFNGIVNEIFELKLKYLGDSYEYEDKVEKTGKVWSRQIELEDKNGKTLVIKWPKI